MNVSVFASGFCIVFLAELGDKTQLTAMALATRHPWKRIFIGIAAAFALLNLGAVLVGKVLFAFLPLFWIKLVSAFLFLFFGVNSLKGGAFNEQEESAAEGRFARRGPAATAFLMIFLAELGDKTQLVTMSLAAQHDAMVEVFAASTLALWSVSLIGIFVGRQLTRFVPLVWVHRTAGALFLLFGGILLFQSFTG